MFISAFLSPYDELFNIKQNFKMKKYMPLEGLRWSRDSGSALCDTSQNSRSRTGWGGVIAYIGRNSMEIYLLHSFFVMIFKEVGVYMISLNSLVTCVTFQIVYSFVLSVIAITLSILIANFLKGSSILKRLLFGL